MQATGTGASSGVEEEGFAALIAVENLVKVTVTEEKATTQPSMRLSASDPLEAFEEGFIDPLRLPFAVDWLVYRSIRHTHTHRERERENTQRQTRYIHFWTYSTMAS